MMVERLIKILRNAGFVDVTAEEIAEMILLADFFPEIETALGEMAPDVDEKSDGASTTLPETAQTPVSESELRPETAKPRQQEASLFDQTAEEITEGEGIGVAPFRAPLAGALPGARKIARALRPLRRRHPSTRRFVLD